jgi:hypothetical protein
MDAVGGDFYLGDAAEGEQEFYEVFGRLFGSLFDDVGDGVGDSGLKGYSAGVEACEVHAHGLAWLEHCGHQTMFALAAGKCKVVRGISEIRKAKLETDEGKRKNQDHAQKPAMIPRSSGQVISCSYIGDGHDVRSANWAVSATMSEDGGLKPSQGRNEWRFGQRLD